MEADDILSMTDKLIIQLSHIPSTSLDAINAHWVKIKLEDTFDLLSTAQYLKEIGLQTLVTVSPTDFPQEDRLELNYFFEDLEHARNVWLQVDIPRDLTRCQIISLTPEFPSANWHEREAFSTFGVRFLEHPQLDYLFVSEDLQGHFPFRKGFDWQAHEANLMDNIHCITSGFNAEHEDIEPFLSDQQSMLSWGPAHPASGPLRLRVLVEGEMIVSVTPDVGYVWRALEHLVEGKDYIGALTALERICFMDNTNAMICYAQAVEQIAGKEITPFAAMMRVLLGEIGRIVSHLMGMGGFFNTMGLVTLQMWCLDVRENFLDVLEDYSGARIATASIEPGGVRYPLELSLLDTLTSAVESYEDSRGDFYNLFLHNPTMKLRAKTLGVISPERVHSHGLCGIVARASGVKTDIRLDQPYAGYAKLQMDYMLSEGGAAFNRFEVLFKELDQSMSLLRQAIADLRQGVEAGIYHPEKDCMVRIPKKLPDGEAISRVEWSRGELLMHLVARKGETNPYRLKIKAPSVNHTMMLSELLQGETLSDIPLVFGSLYICQGDLDR